MDNGHLNPAAFIAKPNRQRCPRCGDLVLSMIVPEFGNADRFYLQCTSPWCTWSQRIAHPLPAPGQTERAAAFTYTANHDDHARGAWKKENRDSCIIKRGICIVPGCDLERSEATLCSVHLLDWNQDGRPRHVPAWIRVRYNSGKPTPEPKRPGKIAGN